MLPDRSRGAQCVVLLQETIEAGDLGRCEQAHGLFHAPEGEKVGRRCPDLKG